MTHEVTVTFTDGTTISGHMMYAYLQGLLLALFINDDDEYLISTGTPGEKIAVNCMLSGQTHILQMLDCGCWESIFDGEDDILPSIHHGA